MALSFSRSPEHEPRNFNVSTAKHAKFIHATLAACIRPDRFSHSMRFDLWNIRHRVAINVYRWTSPAFSLPLPLFIEFWWFNPMPCYAIQANSWLFIVKMLTICETLTAPRRPETKNILSMITVVFGRDHAMVPLESFLCAETKIRAIFLEWAIFGREKFQFLEWWRHFQWKTIHRLEMLAHRNVKYPRRLMLGPGKSYQLHIGINPDG